MQVIDVEPAVHKRVLGNIGYKNIRKVTSVVPSLHDNLVVEQREGNRILKPCAKLGLLRSFDYTGFQKDISDSGRQEAKVKGSYGLVPVIPIFGSSSAETRLMFSW